MGAGKLCSFFKVDNYQLPTTNYQLPTTNYQLPTTNYQLHFANDFWLS
ncbi:MAG: alpha/beta hydrolase [Cyanobacteria bacterium P01_C01_bin.38]